MKNLVVLVVLSLQGCVGVVTHNPEAGEFGNNCIAEGLKEGWQIKFTDGRYGTIKRISGPSQRCADPKFPIRAEVEFQ